jgi:iron complex outermembrane receptor protein
VILDTGNGYEQFTLTMNYEQRVSERLHINYQLGYDRNDVEQARPGLNRIVRAEEDEYHARALLNWEPHEKHKIAAGVEYSYETFEKPHTPPVAPFSLEEWSTRTTSVLGEYQWSITPRWHLFLGGRTDKHTYTDWLFSPRAALVFSMSDKDTLKALYNGFRAACGRFGYPRFVLDDGQRWRNGRYR